MNYLPVSQNPVSGINAIPRMIMMVGCKSNKGFGLLDQFLAYQCQANRFVTLINNSARINHKPDSVFAYDYMISEINQAYLRCTLIGNLKQAISDILKSYQSDLIILQEPGDNDIVDLMDEVSLSSDLIRFDSLTTVLDSFNAERTLEVDAKTQEQVQYADIILLDNKELLDEIRLQHLIRVLKKINPLAPIISMKSKAFDPTLAYGIDLLRYNALSCPKKSLDEVRVDRDDICDQLTAIRCEITHSLDRQRFFEQIKQLPDKVFRMEGLIMFKDEPFPVHLQYVGGRYDMRKFPNPMLKEQFVVVVGKNLNRFRFDF